MIDWSNFTPLPSLAGGALIGLGAAALLLLNGRVAGISGILGAIWRRPDDGLSWRLCFLAGLIAAPLPLSLLGKLAQSSIETSWPVLMLGGVLVGFGTRLGSGCTSGHGVCGLSRRSPRSLIATVTFMATGAFTVYLTRHLLGNG
ncbi:YeeE/YedE family protein [Brenneria populi]|uniref:YeeE/YedE family protein n=1 Tax=Brenneria populi TaxID=1505588 RepID=A0ABU6JQ58_9GAMM|nr:YeeE/YedE family protein [Brenneria populi Li et al. 2015]